MCASFSGSDPLLADLRAIVGDAYALPGEDAPELLTDQLNRYTGRARAVVRPRTTEEVAQVVRLLAGQRVPIVAQGGNTSLTGGATPTAEGSAVVLALTRLDRIRDIDLENDAMTLEAGVLLANAQEAAREAQRLFPLRLPSEGSCTIGGNLATNAGGTQVLRYGNTRALTLGIEVVTADGEIWDGLRALRKDNAGYDLRDLFIGSEGTLGIITAATLRLFPQPAAQRSAFLKFAAIEDVLALFDRAKKGFGSALTAFEIISGATYELVARRLPEQRLPFPAEFGEERWYALVELSDEESDDHARDALERVIGEAIEAGLVQDAVLPESLAQTRAIWELRETGLGSAQKRDGWNAKHDISLPISRIPHFIRSTGDALRQAFPGIRVFTHGHAGDGNLHYQVARPEDTGDDYWLTHETAVRTLVHRAVLAHNGSICAEHGVGALKAHTLPDYKPPLEIALMRRIKDVLDPQGILNPGKVLLA
ncbi:FAD-binding oxidoreductase [Telmatospirillum siberiense]|uniref:Hydroxyacid dehydrogenase n=1 Tax=Telmatospirillum siberiense TaxID=382514 RepID=A0A2N3PSJ0_9PROT|nr:FAD-binding oxidoreductase [Telmatospirillum siberiense]PKU23354.1 hydroxyacid dehydrogenase [Telmatospirillum siberiense]